MRAWEIVSDGGIEVLALNRRPSLEPGPGQVLVKVGASSINYRDLSTIEDPKARNIPYPTVPNSDCAGEVAAVRLGVKRVRDGGHRTSPGLHLAAGQYFLLTHTKFVFRSRGFRFGAGDAGCWNGPQSAQQVAVHFDACGACGRGGDDSVVFVTLKPKYSALRLGPDSD